MRHRCCLIALCAWLAAGCAPAVWTAGGGGGGGTGVNGPNGEALGQADTFFGVPVMSWVAYGSDGHVSEVGATIPYAAVVAAPTDPAAPAVRLTLELPAAAKGDTWIDHVTLAFAPTGHAPSEPYGIAQFDVRFVGMSSAAESQIACPTTAQAVANQLPSHYAFLPAPMGSCDPAVGLRAFDLRAPELTGVPSPLASQGLAYAYGTGGLAMLEPMGSRAYLLSKPSFGFVLPTPPSLGRSTRFPQFFTLTYDAGTDTFQAIVSGFAQAS